MHPPPDLVAKGSNKEEGEDRKVTRTPARTASRWAPREYPTSSPLCSRRTHIPSPPMKTLIISKVSSLCKNARLERSEAGIRRHLH